MKTNYVKPNVTINETALRTSLLAGSGGSYGNPCLHCTIKPAACWMCGNNGRFPKN